MLGFGGCRPAGGQEGLSRALYRESGSSPPAPRREHLAGICPERRPRALAGSIISSAFPVARG